jgi:hypothetical protein
MDIQTAMQIVQTGNIQDPRFAEAQAMLQSLSGAGGPPVPLDSTATQYPSLADEPSPQDQFTRAELEQLGGLGMYDENQTANERAIARAAKLRGGGGYQGGTYGRWGTPMPYNPWGDIAREVGGAIGEYRGEKKAAGERERAKKALGMYEGRTRNPRGAISQKTAQAIEDIPVPQIAEESESTWDKIRKYGRRFA